MHHTIGMAVRQATAQLLHVQLYLQPRPLCQGVLIGTMKWIAAPFDDTCDTACPGWYHRLSWQDAPSTSRARLPATQRAMKATAQHRCMCCIGVMVLPLGKSLCRPDMQDGHDLQSALAHLWDREPVTFPLHETSQIVIHVVKYHVYTALHAIHSMHCMSKMVSGPVSGQATDLLTTSTVQSLCEIAHPESVQFPAGRLRFRD